MINNGTNITNATGIYYGDVSANAAWVGYFKVGPDSNSVITYTTADDCSLNLSSSIADASILNHTYSNGTGTIIFDGPVTILHGNYFSYHKVQHLLTSINLPDTIRQLGVKPQAASLPDGAFCEQTSLTSITFPKRMYALSDYLFDETTPNGTQDASIAYALSNVTINNGITSIGREVFGNCPQLLHVDLPSSIAGIYSNSFYPHKGSYDISTGYMYDNGSMSVCFPDHTSVPNFHIASSSEQNYPPGKGYDNNTPTGYESRGKVYYYVPDNLLNSWKNAGSANLSGMSSYIKPMSEYQS